MVHGDESLWRRSVPKDEEGTAVSMNTLPVAGDSFHFQDGLVVKMVRMDSNGERVHTVQCAVW